MVWDDIHKRPDKDEFFNMLQQKGVVGTQSQLREIDRLISQGFGDTVKETCSRAWRTRHDGNLDKHAHA